MSLLTQTLTTRTPTAIALEETLLWLCRIPSPIGEERALCDAVQARLATLWKTAAEAEARTPTG